MQESNKIFKHKVSGKIYRLLTKRSTGVNTYLEVTKKNTPVIKKQGWSYHPKRSLSIIKGYDNLIEI